MIDRGMIKWQPFDSCFSSKKVINSISKEKSKITMPILSEDQISTIADKIIEAYNLKLIISIDYYYDGIIKQIKGKIYSIDSQQKRICLNNKIIYFKQILKIH